MGDFYSNIAYFKQIYKEEKLKIVFLTRKLTSADIVLNSQNFCEKVYYIKEYRRGLKGVIENFKSFVNIVKLLKNINPKKIFILHDSSRYTLSSIFSNVSRDYIYAPGYRLQNFSIKRENKIFKSFFTGPLVSKLANKLLVEKIYKKKISEDNSISYSIHQKKYVCIMIAQSGTSRQWGKEKYIKIIEYLYSKGFKNFLILSGPLQKNMEKEIVNFFDKFNIEFIKTSHLNMQDCLNFLSQSKFYVGNDSGFPHLSISLKIPTIAISGDCVPQYHLYDEKDLIYSVDTDFPEIRKGGSDSAIKTISYEKVKNAVDQLLKDHAIAP